MSERISLNFLQPAELELGRHWTIANGNDTLCCKLVRYSFDGISLPVSSNSIRAKNSTIQSSKAKITLPCFANPDLVSNPLEKLRSAGLAEAVPINCFGYRPAQLETPRP